MVLAWQQWDESLIAQQLNGSEYFQLIEATFGNDLAVISYLRNRLAGPPVATLDPTHRRPGLPPDESSPSAG
jgi:hypothetical protein